MRFLIIGFLGIPLYAQFVPTVFNKGGVSGALSCTATLSATTVNLNTGTLDWKTWGADGTVPGLYNKSCSGSPCGLLSTYSLVGGATATNYGSDSRDLHWDSGSGLPNDGRADNTSGLYTGGVGKGFSITCPASTVSHTCIYYAGGYDSTAQLSATLSDGSHAPATNTTTCTGGGSYDCTWSCTYNAASAGQTLTLQITSNGALNVNINGATYQ